MEAESILLPLAMFEDFIKNGVKSWYGDEILKEIQSGEYKSKPNDEARIKLCAWLHRNSLFSLIQADNSDTNTENPKADS